jgi:hypothetical protein
LVGCNFVKWQNAGLPTAGFVMDPKISATGEIDLCAVITDPAAAQKVATRVYTGAVICFDGDEISDVSLVDSPVSFMQKRSLVICSIYSNGGGEVKDWKRAQKMTKRFGGTPAQNYAALKAVRKANAPAIPVSAQAAFEEIERTEKVLASGTCGDRMAATAQNHRARQQIGVEFIKAARQPGNQLWGPKFR